MPRIWHKICLRYAQGHPSYIIQKNVTLFLEKKKIIWKSLIAQPDNGHPTNQPTDNPNIKHIQIISINRWIGSNWDIWRCATLYIYCNLVLYYQSCRALSFPQPSRLARKLNELYLKPLSL